jgi:hypothetical protein
MALYDTRFGLPQGVADYLNQALPDISNLYTPPVAGINPIKPDPDDPEGIISLYPQVAASGDGGGFSPYSIDPRDVTIRTSDQYNPYAYRQAAESRYVGDLYPTETGLQKQMSMYPDYYGVQGRTLTGIEQLMSKIPTPLGFIKRGIDALADKLPVNRTAIFQNELLGQGFKLDNIGRIVTDNYNTPEGIMAGYNPVSGGLLNMLTGGAYGEPTTYGLDKSFDKRTETISNTLKEKYGMSDAEVAAALTGEYKGSVQTPLINRLSLIQQARNKFASAQQAKDIITQRKEEQRAKEEQKAQMQREQSTIDRARQAAPDVYREAERQGFTGPGGGFSTSGSKPGTSLGSGQFKSSSNPRGRKDY